MKLVKNTLNEQSELKLDLHIIPTPSNTPPTRPACFSVVSVAIASLPPDKSTITSLLVSLVGGEVLRKSSKLYYLLGLMKKTLNSFYYDIFIMRIEKI